MKAGPVIEGHFFNANKSNLKYLFQVLGRENEWSDDLAGIIDYTQAKWVGLEHGNSSEKDQFTPDQATQAIEVLAEMGFRDQVPPKPDHYEHIVIVGGLMRVNRQRIGFMHQHIGTHVSANNIVFFAGQRERDNREDAELEAVDLSALEHNEWVRGEAVKPFPAGPGSRFSTETALARLAFLEEFPDAQQISLVGPRRYDFATGALPPFTVLDSPKVNRPQGFPRHTTASSTLEWLNQMPPSENANVLIIDGNPHIMRDLRDITGAAAHAGRPDIEFTVSGPAAKPNALVQLYLGEIGRLLYMDTQLEVSA